MGRTCMSNPKCHWGPTELKRCRTDNDAYRAAQHPTLAQNGMESWWGQIMANLFDSSGNLSSKVIKKIESFYRDHVMGMFDDNGNFGGFGFEDDDTCKCYGGDACETGDRMNIDTCLSNSVCHWGPGERQECADAQHNWQMTHSAGP